MKKILLFTFFLSIGLQSCEEEIYSSIPNYPVNITLDLDFGDNELVAALATKSITQPRKGTDKLGYGGILVINGLSLNGDIVNLYAYDLTCPVEVDRNIKIIPDEVGKARCPHCKAVYDISSGYGIPESETKLRLKTYSVRPESGGRRYRIRN